MTYKEELLREICILKRQLEDAIIDKNEFLQDADVMETSKKLDSLLIQYLKFSMKDKNIV
jgi:hypothetical protein